MAAPAKPISSIESITPAKARQMLARNASFNRPMRITHVNHLARLIEKGEWTLNNDAIVIASTGELLNGQHRLSAIIKANKAVTIAVITNADPEAYAAMDSGAVRSMADRTSQSALLVADATLLFTSTMNANSRMKPTPPEILDIIEWWRPAYDAVQAGTGGVRRAGMDSAPIRVGFGMRWATMKTKEQREHLLVQYRHMLMSNTRDLDQAIATMWMRLAKNNGTHHSTREARVMLASEVFYYTNPAKKDVAPLIRDGGETRAEFIGWVRLMEKAWADAPAGGFPYLWKEAPQVGKKLHGQAKILVEQKAARSNA